MLSHVALSKKSEFQYVRGRRRIGKTWLLKELQKKFPCQCFYCAGAKGARLSVKKSNFANEWDRFAGETLLSKYRASELDWPMILKTVGQFAKRKKKNLTLIFDEIQWLAGGGDSFASDLKTAWADWQRDGFIKVIVCGSSSKFFKDVTGGPDKVLRGLQTRPHLWVNPISPVEVHVQLCPKWKPEETTLLYMMTGGVPYYLERIDPKKGFIHAVNDAFFIAEGNLLDEVDELLNYDFNATGIKTVKKVLAALGQDGCSQTNILLKTGLPQTTVNEIIEKLLDYEIVFEKAPQSHQKKQNRSGVKYFMKDFFLNFYFQVLRKCEAQIKNNIDSLIFPVEAGLSLNGLYVPNFSGKAFELFVRHLLENPQILQTPLGKKLQLKNVDSTVGDYWDANTQIDLIVENKKDRITRIIECKWQEFSSEMIQVALRKTMPTRQIIKHYLFIPTIRNQGKENEVQDQGVTVLCLKDYFRC